MKSKNYYLLILLIIVSFSVKAQTIYDTWQRSQSRWQLDMGISGGPTTGLQFQYFTPRRNTCKTLLKKVGFDFGFYYEGLFFANDLKTKEAGWAQGGYRGNMSLVFFPDIRIPANRFFIGGGLETGTRVLDNEKEFQTDFIAKVGWEFSFLPSTGMMLALRLSLKYDKSFTNDFTYILPTLGLIYGK